VRAGLGDVLAVVQQQPDVPVAQRRDQRLEQRLTGAFPQFERGEDVPQQIMRADGVQLDQPGSAAADTGREPQRQPRLPRSARPNQGEQPSRPPQGPQPAEFRDPADELVEDLRQALAGRLFLGLRLGAHPEGALAAGVAAVLGGTAASCVLDRLAAHGTHRG